ncbi:cyclin-T1 isoform X5 [Corythoichthys intestinalis]|uniref:cyclin-T1 isoform X5 n=1 Tax=Corythoichthys intestinalis TaxID=161448 RepID=UPI0025A54597|nr:cyclin-T1 isoform X5 [Corythoichthys intestinalis]
MAASLRCLPASCNNKWYYSRQEIDNNPSRRAGLDPDKELSYRQQAANLLQDMGQRLNVSQLTINTAIVYMHRFYMVQSFTRFHRNVISPAALFLAAKVEEQPRKLEHVIKVAHACLNPQEPSPDVRSDRLKLPLTIPTRTWSSAPSWSEQARTWLKRLISWQPTVST